MENPKTIDSIYLLAFIKSLSLCDHMGDVFGDCSWVLKMLNLNQDVLKVFDENSEDPVPDIPYLHELEEYFKKQKENQND